MTITRTEVCLALYDAAAVCHGDVLSNTPVTISQGTLALLIEAAKCARYRNVHATLVDAPSNSELILDDKSHAPVASPVEDE